MLPVKKSTAFLLLALLPGTLLALDLTPISSFREMEGFKIPVLLFSDAGKKISFQPPAKWVVSGGGATLSLYPPDVPDAVMQMRVRAIRPLPAGMTEDFEKWCRAQLPQDAAQPTLESQAENVFMLGTLGSRQYTYSYAAQGRRFTTSVAIVDWTPTERLAVVVTARSTDFVNVQGTAIASIFSWGANSN
jgi:hypothetical protein